MLKGVNKSVVEVVELESEYFEKAILFLRPGKSAADEGTLRRKASEYLGGIRYQPHRKRPSLWLLAAGLAALTVLLAGVAAVLILV